MPRKQISKKLRFEIFKRDSFTCQYCGDKAPDVILHVDHISPVAGGGDNNIINLVTSCEACNLGKGAKALDDSAMLAKQRQQLKELSERREQLKLMVKWQQELSNMDNELVSAVAGIVFNDTGRCFTEYGAESVKKLIKKYGYPEVMESASISRAQYFIESDESSLQKVIDYIGRICAVRKRDKENPEESRLFYIRAIVRNRMYCNEWKCMNLLRGALTGGSSLEDLEYLAKDCRNWTEWCACMEDLQP
jgi:hypothetical protein